MKKQNLILIIIGFILIVIPFFIQIFSIFRLISLLLGIIVLLLGLILNKKNKLLRIIFYPVILISGLLLLDLFLAKMFSSVPVIAFAHESSSKVSTYNSLFFRVYDCDGVLTYDGNYNQDYLCNPSAIEKVSINKYLENPKESYKKTHGKFIHLEGKINTIVGNSSLTLNAYDEKVEINGYVVFDEEKKIIVEGLDIDPADYHVYDLASVVGLVDTYKETNEETIIYLTDAKVIKSDLYNEYSLMVNNISSREKEKIDEKLYYLGIQGIFYKYDENNIYEIDYLLLDKRETLENLIGKVTPSLIEDVHKLYELENYNLIICEDEDVIFANKDITNLKNVCDKEEN